MVSLKIFIVLGFFAFISFWLIYFLFGCFKSIRARELTESEKRDISIGGISHFTSSKGAFGISNDRLVKKSSFRASYSAHFRRSSFFYANSYINEQTRLFNTGRKKQCKIVIENLSEEQLCKFRIRDFDKSLIYRGDFVFNKANIWHIEIFEAPPKRITDGIYWNYNSYLVLAFFLVCAFSIPITIIILYNIL